MTAHRFRVGVDIGGTFKKPLSRTAGEGAERSEAGEGAAANLIVR